MRRVALLKRGQRSGGGANDDAVGGLLGGEAVAEVPEEHVIHKGIGIAVAQLGQAADHMQRLFRGGKQHGEHDQRALALL